jgi:hypothetical protein
MPSRPSSESCACGACTALEALRALNAAHQQKKAPAHQPLAFSVARLPAAHCETLSRVVSKSLEHLFSAGEGAPGLPPPGDDDDDDNGDGDILVWPTGGWSPLMALRVLLPLSAGRRLSAALALRLAFLFLRSIRADAEGEDGLVSYDARESASARGHGFAFDRPSRGAAGEDLVSENSWLRLLLRAFQSLTTCEEVARAQSCCLPTFVDELGVACFRGLAAAEPSVQVARAVDGTASPLTFSARAALARGQSVPVETDAHLLFFGLRYWSLVRSSEAVDDSSGMLPQTCALIPSLGWGSVAARTYATWIPRSLSDHAMLVMLLLRLFRTAGVSDDSAATAVASLRRHAVKVFGLDCEIYSFELEAPQYAALRAPGVTHELDGLPESETHVVQVFVEFSRMWLDAPQSSPTGGSTSRVLRHAGAVAKHRWLSSLLDGADLTGDHSVSVPLFFDVQVPVAFASDTSRKPPFSDFRAFFGAPPSSPVPQWLPCMLRSRNTSEVGRGLKWGDWNRSAGVLVNELWDNTEWRARLGAVVEASRSLIELVASMSDEECERGVCMGNNGEEFKWTQTYMKGAMWQLRLPALAEVAQTRLGKFVCGDVLGVRLHVFEDCAETIPHNHGIPFFSALLQGQYVQTLWKDVSGDDVEAQAREDDGHALPRDPGQFILPQRPPKLPSAMPRDTHDFVGVERPFRTSRPVLTDEHGAGVTSEPPPARSSSEFPEKVVGSFKLQKSFFHTHRAGSVYFIGPQWIHTVDATKEPVRAVAQTNNSVSDGRVISLVFRLPTYFGALKSATFFVPQQCVCDVTPCTCSTLQLRRGEETSAGSTEAALAAASTAAVRGTYGVSMEGTPESFDVMLECRRACRNFLASEFAQQ